MYRWKRFWCPWEGNYLLTDDGYLYYSESDTFRDRCPDVVSFQSISNNHCLILLGEPGIGKTSAMNEEEKIIDSGIEVSGGKALRIDLNSISASSDLSEKLFENKAIQDWIKGEYPLHIFLDSLDECLLRIDNLSAMLIDRLNHYPKERLYLRIACRTADWQRLRILENELKRIWGKDNFGVFELLPLTRRDVLTAAKMKGIDPEIFLSEIVDRDAGPMAARPVTLKFLLDMYSSNKKIPYGKIDLYYEGCKLLCKEPNKYRKASGHTGKLSWDQRMIVAARIAAITIFSKKDVVICDDSASIKNNEIKIYFLCGGKECIREIEFNITEETIKETLSISGLFNSRGSGRMGWVHQTYAEFLAAWYVTQNKITLDQVKSLIYHPTEKIVPQLHGVTSWLCSMDQGLFEEVLKTEPEILLFTDLMNIREEDRELLVRTLLEQYDKRKLWDQPQLSLLKKLNHGKLGDQLRPYILDRNNSILVRQIAISIAIACNLQLATDELLDVALDPSDEQTVRSWAVQALINLENDETKKRLRPLALGKAGNDPEDELKGYALRALWPNFITSEELFSVLTNPKNPDQIGSYYVFISHYLMDGLKEEHLPAALNWVERYGPSRGMRGMLNPFRDSINEIIKKAATYLSSPSLLDPFAKAAASLLLNDDILIDRNAGSFCLCKEEIRHEIVLKILPELLEANAYLGCLVDFETPLILSKDIPWMIECLNRAKSEQFQRAWASLIEMTFDQSVVIKYLDIILTTCKNNSILASTFSKIIDPIDLGSDRAKEMKESYQKRQRHLEDIEKPIPLDPSPKERTAAMLDDFDSGNLAAWYWLTMNLTLEPYSTHYKDGFESDLTITSGWKVADTQTKARILRAAKIYLARQDPEMAGLMDTNTLSYQAISGFKALRLLLHEDPEYLSVLSSDLWKKWTPAIIAYPLFSSIENEKVHGELFNIAYKNAPEGMINCLSIIINKENKKFDKIYIISKFENCWDTRLANFLVYKAKDQSLKLTCLLDILRPILEHNIEEIRSFTDSYIISLPQLFGEERTKAIAISSILMSHAQDAGWSAVWPAFRHDHKFGQDVILTIENSIGLRSAGIELKLTESQLVDLYLWLVGRYPYSEDPDRMHSHFVTPRENIGQWRDSLLSQLSKMGTLEACEGLHRIVGELPKLELAEYMLASALKNYCNKSWKPTEPEHILELFENQEKRLVESGDQLVKVLLESLRRLEKKLHDETPASRDIWDLVDRKNKLYRPIYEEELSDYVKRHLSEDIGKRGIVLGRNTRIHRGDETDIHVDAQKEKDDFFEPVSAIIEVKGCWNQELGSAMKLQLNDRYLKDNNCTHGIYLIAWFNCEWWDKNDSNYKKSPKIGIENARTKYSAQATELSDESTHIEAFVLDARL